MLELLKNAWSGWFEYTDNGKYAILLIVVLMFFWFRREACKEKLLLVYTTIMTVCCIFPVSAAMLMTYQTRFYDYEWIWNYVPVTLILAYGAVIFIEWLCERYLENGKKHGKWNRYIPAGVTVLVVVLIFLSGRLGQAIPGVQADSEQQHGAEEILNMLVETAEGEELCLWAPKEIMEYARAEHAEVKVLYGRDMWEAALGAYSYETYGEDEQMLYRWMCNAEETGKENFKIDDDNVIKGAVCVKTAVKAGVNRILLPDNMESKNVKTLAKRIKAKVQTMEGYYLLIL